MSDISFTCVVFVAAAWFMAGAGGNDNDADPENNIFIDRAEAKAYPGFSFQGEYTGFARRSQDGEYRDAGVQIAVYEENRFKGMLYLGGLPGDHTGPDGSGTFLEQIELEGVLVNGVLQLEAVDYPISVRKIHDHLSVFDEDSNHLGHLNPVHRSGTTAGMEPPEGALVLFAGRGSDLAGYWDEDTEMAGELLKQGARTAAVYGDMRLHLEAKVGFMPEAASQGRTNSGIYIQRRYEVQILDSFGLPPALNSNASLYNEVEPKFNPTFPPLTWQTYDVYFRAPRFDRQGNKTANARVTVYLNGFLVIDDEELEQGTGAGGQFEEVPEAEIYLQDHTGPVRFRNVWLVEEEYSPPGVNRLVPGI